MLDIIDPTTISATFRDHLFFEVLGGSTSLTDILVGAGNPLYSAVGAVQFNVNRFRPLSCGDQVAIEHQG